ncbi:MAG: integron integrase [Acidobacteriota bacterium]|nr:MAG: integron integrase [Acidobacteriota bacterium]
MKASSEGGGPQKPRPATLLARVREEIRLRQYSPRTEKSYIGWIKRFLRFHGGRHPRDLGPEEVKKFVSSLVTDGNVSASTQNQALSALTFLYKAVLKKELPWLDGIMRAKRPQRLPVVLTRAEVDRLLDELSGAAWLVASLMYGAGLRLHEALQLRIKDVDLETRQITVRDGKGRKDRVTVLPDQLVNRLREQMRAAFLLHRRSLKQDGGWVALPNALARKFPSAARDWRWQYVFPATREYRDRRTKRRCRHHLHPTVLQRAIPEVGRRAGIPKRVTCHALRHSFANHLIQSAADIRKILKLLGHHDVRTKMI